MRVAPARRLSGVWCRLHEPVDLGWIVFFRIGFGGIMIWEAWRYLSSDWIDRYFIDPVFRFGYYGFEWVRPWPGDGMYWHFWGLGILGACISIGLCYRAAAILFFLGFTYVFLLDQSNYLNHFYLVSLLAFVLIFLPAHRAWSADAWMRPSLRAAAAPAWTLWALRAQIGIPYFYAGLAKLNGDWLRGEPMRTWMQKRSDDPLLGEFLVHPWASYLSSWGGMVFDLLVIPALLWRRTRFLALAAAVFFHLMNARLFTIGIFPWLSLLALPVFLPHDWAGRAWKYIRSKLRLPGREEPLRSPSPLSTSRLTAAVIGIHFVLQVLVPLRHHLYPGDVAWTEEGDRFSWRMKLQTKRAAIRLKAVDPRSGRAYEVAPLDVLTGRQVDVMGSRPDMILQFAHYLARRFENEYGHRPGIRVNCLVSLNGRPFARLVDDTVDLAAQPRSLWRASWILPLSEPLPVAGEAGSASRHLAQDPDQDD